MKLVLRVAFSLVLMLSLLGAYELRAAAQGEQRQNGGKQQQAPQLPPAEATVTLNEQFLNSLLDAVFTNLRAPSFPLSLSESQPARGTTAPKSSNALAASKFN